MWEKIVAIAVAFLAGAAGSLFAPWANWQVEKRRHKLNSREEIIRDALVMIVDYTKGSESGYAHIFGKSLRANSNYLRLKPYLNETALAQIREVENSKLASDEVRDVLMVLEREVVRLKKEWELV